ncbi:hypothetical protein VIGAN_04344900 [Vigna angularis var. angularis]|uniref:Uncharacterized protein n=1 Tax=Vigna angularis var. angularis TaxID=157739 RepID=A0A0S3RZ38_PHAAN|nr:hypothetical protein VIGAN_04344900 [Vigna angularis var. angularis]
MHSFDLEKSTRELELEPNAMIRRSVLCGPKRKARAQPFTVCLGKEGVAPSITTTTHHSLHLPISFLPSVIFNLCFIFLPNNHSLSLMFLYQCTSTTFH